MYMFNSYTNCVMLVICFIAVHVGQDVSAAVSHRICCSEFKECEIYAVIFHFTLFCLM